MNRLYLRAAILLFAGSLMAQPVAVTAATASTSAIAQGFTVSGDTKNFVGGALVSSGASGSQQVALATPETASRLVGIVAETPLLALSSGATAQVQVVIGGTTTVLVSDINGSVNVGDRITASPIAGVGMAATADTQVVGVAQSRLKDVATTSRTVKDRAGKSHTVRIGLVPVRVGVASYRTPINSFLPPAVQDLANSIAGRNVSFGRIIMSGIILLLALVSIVALLYAAVRSGIISIGRNPLAAGAIRRGLLQVGGIIVLIVVFALLATYLLLLY